MRIQVLIHDAARPLVSHRLIDETLEKLTRNDAVVCAIPVQDSLFRKNDGRIAEILERSSIMQSQTPQSFELQTILNAFQLHHTDKKIIVTDDISLIKCYLPTTEIAIVTGESYNIKLTKAHDLKILEYYQQIMNLYEQSRAAVYRIHLKN